MFEWNSIWGLVHTAAISLQAAWGRLCPHNDMTCAVPHCHEAETEGVLKANKQRWSINIQNKKRRVLSVIRLDTEWDPESFFRLAW